MVTLTLDINKDPKNFKNASYTNEKKPKRQNAKFSNHMLFKCWQYQNIQEKRRGKKWWQNNRINCGKTKTLKVHWALRPLCANCIVFAFDKDLVTFPTKSLVFILARVMFWALDTNSHWIEHEKEQSEWVRIISKQFRAIYRIKRANFPCISPPINIGKNTNWSLEKKLCDLLSPNDVIHWWYGLLILYWHLATFWWIPTIQRKKHF